MNTVVLTILGLGVALALAGTLRACRRQWLTLGPGLTLTWGLLRSVALLLLLRLAWQILLAPVPEADPQAGPPPKLLVLTDVSASMAATAGPGETRADLARAVTARLRTLADASPRPPEIVPFVFADGLASADQPPPPPNATQLTRALTELLTREPAAALLLLSDGASSDGSPPRLWRDWATNRGLGLYAIGTFLEPVPPDLRLTGLSVAPRNPEEVKALVTATGLAPDQAWECLLTVDGRQSQRQRFTGNGSWPIAWPLGDLSAGWHELAFTLPPLAGELSTRNNLALAVFQVAPPAGIVFLQGAPRLDDTQALRFWRQRLGDRLASYRVDDLALAKLPVAALRLVILGAVAPEELPGPLVAALRGGQVHGLWLGGPYLGQWAGIVPDFPLLASTGLVNLAARHLPPAVVRPAVAQATPWLLAPSQASLTLNHLQGVTVAAGAWVPLLAVAGESWPLLLADREAQPRRVVWTAEGHWKWLLRPEPRARQAAETFWAGLADWLLGGDDQSQELLLDLQARPDGSAQVTVTARQDDWLPRLRELKLSQSMGGSLAPPVPVARGSGGWQQTFPPPTQRPVVQWYSAEAQLDGRVVRSARQPLLIADDPGEWLDPAPRPELLRQWAREAGHLALAPEADGVLTTLLADLAKRDPPGHRRRRQPGPELWLAGVIAALLGADWWRERRAAQALGR